MASSTRQPRRSLSHITVAAFTLAVATPAWPQPTAVERFRLPDGRALAFRCSGRGTPTVLLEGGWAASSLAWARVQPLVATTTRVCSYDRAGMGLSDPGPDPRDGTAIARDLADGLRAAKIAPPFVVVGHSAGGLYVRVFAGLHPDQVVGMVLVDPSVEYQDRRLSAIFGPGAGSVAGLRSRSAACLAAAQAHALPSVAPELTKCDPATPVGTWRTEVAELDGLWGATSDEVGERPNYGAMPLIVLTAGDTNAALPADARRTADRIWARFHDDVAARSTAGVRRTVIGSGHLIPKDRPDAVAAAVADVVAAVRAGSKPR
jgi:pimeloyl-ACP methyl ester carboxylesterase